jgi:hypothetical protein
MFKKLLAWIGIGAEHTETVREILTPPASVAETIKQAVTEGAIKGGTGAVKPKSRNRRRRPKSPKAPVATK